MNIEITQKCVNAETQQKSQSSNVKTDDVKFADELKELKNSEKKEKVSETPVSDKQNNCVENQKTEVQENLKSEEVTKNSDIKQIDGAIDGLQDVFDEMNKLNRTNENELNLLKQNSPFDEKENKHEELGLIDNNMNIQEPKEKINLQMGSNTNFSGDGQPFAEFVNAEKNKEVLKSSAKDLAEEKAILSTMEENVAIANKNMAMGKNKTVQNEHGIKKVDKNTNVTVETIVSYDKVIVDRADAEFFINLVEKGEVNLNEISNASKSSAVSKTLADLIAKSMQDNKPIRIDFDNDISVIIKVGKDGKISADFLPSSQVAEAYLKENLPLLKQRFDDNNIEYNELNHRKQKQDDQENRKKGRKDE